MIASVTRRNLVLIFCILLLAYAYVLPRRVDWSQQSRLSLTRAMVERDTVRIDAYVRDTGEFAIYEGHAYTEKAPGPSFIGLPIYAVVLPLLEYPAVSSFLEWLARDRIPKDIRERAVKTENLREFTAQYLLTLAVIAIPAAAAGMLFYHFLSLFDVAHGLRALIVLAYGLGTPAATYAGNFYSHQIIAVLCFGAFVLLVWLGRGSGGSARALLVGLLLGYAVISEYSAVIIVLILGTYAWISISRFRFVVMLVGTTLPLTLLIMYDIIAFDTPFPVSYSYSVVQREAYQTGFMGITYPRLEALYGLTFSPFRGLFVRAPWLLLALPGFVLWWKQEHFREELWVVVGITLSMLLFYSSAVLWWGGFAAGPRHIVPALPFMTLGAVPILSALWNLRAPRRLAVRIGFMMLVAVSVVLTWSEAVAGHTFPPDDIRAPWAKWVVPAWREGFLTDNIGTVLGLPTTLSLLPLAGIVTVLVSLLVLSCMRLDRAHQPAAVPQIQTLGANHH